MSIAEFIAMMTEVVQGQRPLEDVMTATATADDGPGFVAIDTTNPRQDLADVEAQLDAWEAAMTARETCPHGALVARAAGGWYCLTCGRVR
jgi:hypothetical protein